MMAGIAGTEAFSGAPAQTGSERCSSGVAGSFRDALSVAFSIVIALLRLQIIRRAWFCIGGDDVIVQNRPFQAELLKNSCVETGLTA